ncbi:MAG: hypothetical protein ACYTKD_06465 [Planctomycetota bacterium]|jgi:hypothetical protein
MSRVPALAAVALAAGCGTGPFDGMLPVADPALRDRLVREAGDVYPESFRMLHRVVLTVGGREFDFTGYVLVSRPGALRAVAFGEIGGTYFDVVTRAPDEARVVRSPARMRVEWLVEGVAWPLRDLYVDAPSADSHLVRLRDGRLGLLAFRQGGDAALTIFAPGGAKPEALVVCRSGRPTREARLSDWGPAPGSGREVPRRIVVADRTRGYRFEASLVKLNEVDPPDRLFDVPDGNGEEGGR